MEKDNNKRSVICFHSVKRLIIFLVCAAVITTTLLIVESTRLAEAQNVESVDSLSGQRIGCSIGWESDVLLSDRNDITLMRYDDNATALVALSYNQVDAVSMDAVTWNSVEAITEGLEAFGDPIATIGLAMLISSDRKDLYDQFNEFIEDFTASDEYEDFDARCSFKNSDVFEKADIKLPIGKNILRACYVPEYYPQSFVNTVTGEADGVNVEAVERFAAAYGYTVVWEQASEIDADVGLMNGKYDIVATGSTDVYRPDYEAICYMTEPFYYTDVYVIRVKDGQKMKLKGVVQT